MVTHREMAVAQCDRVVKIGSGLEKEPANIL